MAASRSSYSDSLDYESRKRYFDKLKTDYEVLLDPYSVSDDQWVDDVRKWPSVEFGDLYSYLIETKGPYTKESLKAYKSLEAYNYFHSGYVHTVLFYESSPASQYAVLKARVKRSVDKPHDAWVIVDKGNGSVRSGHCTCMAG